MSIRLDGDILRLEGDCGVEDAETLVGLVHASGAARADLGLCRHLHSAVAQALLAFRLPVEGASGNPFLRDWVIPAIETARSGASERQPVGETVEHQSMREASASASERS